MCDLGKMHDWEASMDEKKGDFLEDNIVYAITAIDCDYDECQKVMNWIH